MHAENSPPRRYFTYKDLDAWKLSRALAIAVINLTEQPPLKRNWGLADQMQRSSVSVPSNIAEGDERGSNKDTLRFLYISKGSLAELRTQLDIAHATGKINTADFQKLEDLADQVARLLSGLIRKRTLRERSGQ